MGGKLGKGLWKIYSWFFAQLAQKKIELFCFGTELGNSVAKTMYWSNSFIKLENLFLEINIYC
jgi:hypothetical protein